MLAFVKKAGGKTDSKDAKNDNSVAKEREKHGWPPAELLVEKDRSKITVTDTWSNYRVVKSIFTIEQESLKAKWKDNPHAFCKECEKPRQI
jgi:hypothetical protein